MCIRDRGKMIEMDSPLPVLAITMGDGAGIGPEIVVKALSRPEAVSYTHLTLPTSDLV